MWTSDAMLAMEAIQMRAGYPVCITSVIQPEGSKYIYIKTDGGFWLFDIISHRLTWHNS